MNKKEKAEKLQLNEKIKLKGESMSTTNINASGNRIYVGFQSSGEISSVKNLFSLLRSLDKSQAKREYLTRAYVFYEKYKDKPLYSCKGFGLIALAEYIYTKSNPDLADEKVLEDFLLTATMSTAVPLSGKFRCTYGFSDHDSEQMKLYEKLTPLTNKERIVFLVDITEFYQNSGQDETFLAYESKRLLNNIIIQYRKSSTERDKKNLLRYMRSLYFLQKKFFDGTKI